MDCLVGALHLAHGNQVHLSPTHDARAGKGLEAKHQLGDAFDGPMVLLDDVAQVGSLSNDDCFAFGIDVV